MLTTIFPDLGKYEYSARIPSSADDCSVCAMVERLEAKGWSFCGVAASRQARPLLIFRRRKVPEPK